MNNTLKIVLSGILIALSIVLTRVFSVDLIIAGVPAARLAAGFVPIILASIILGPVFGMMVGGISDVLGFLIASSGGYFPLITLTSIVVGLLPYLIYRWTKKYAEWVRILLAVSITQVICGMFMQTLWLSMLFGAPYAALFFPRVITTLIMIPIYAVLVFTILKGLKKANIIGKTGGILGAE